MEHIVFVEKTVSKHLVNQILNFIENNSFFCFFRQCPEFYRNISLVSRSVTFNQARGIFGFVDTGKITFEFVLFNKVGTCDSSDRF